LANENDQDFEYPIFPQEKRYFSQRSLGRGNNSLSRSPSPTRNFIKQIRRKRGTNVNRKLGRDLYRKKQQTFDSRETSAQYNPASDPYPKNISAEVRKKEASKPLYIMRYE